MELILAQFCMSTQWPVVEPVDPNTWGMAGRKSGKGKGSTSQAALDSGEDFMLAFMESLDDEQVAAKLSRIIKSSNREILDSVTSLSAQVQSLKEALAQRDAVINDLRAEVSELRHQNDALEQHGRRNSLRISGISEEWEENTTEAIVNIANEVMKVDPPLSPSDIDISHRLPKPRSAKPAEPRPVIVRFIKRTDRFRVISSRTNLKQYNEDKEHKIYINEDLTAFRAKLFMTIRRLQKKKLFDQTWTYNGNIKVKTRNGEVKSIFSYDDIKKLLPNVNLNDV